MGISLSTLIYLSVFILTMVCAAISHRCFDKKLKAAGIIFAVVTILLPSVLAGVRADTVGRDVMLYGVRIFEEARASFSFWGFVKDSRTVGLNMLAYGVSRIFPDPGWLLFFLQLLVMAPLVMAAYKYRGKAPMWMTVCTYLFMFYNNSLNIMKQSISCAFLLLAFFYFREKKFLRTIPLGAVALLFHSSAIIGIVVIAVVTLVGKTKTLWLKVFVIVALVFVIANLESISKFLLSSGILPDKYAVHINEFFDESNTSLKVKAFYFIDIYDWVFRVLLCLCPIYALYYTKREQDAAINLITIIGLSIYTYTYFVYQTQYGGRVSLYCDFFYILLVPRMFSAVKVKLSNGLDLTPPSMVLLLFIYWFPWVMIFGWSASNHFAFRF